jgi:hypothetical protein
MAHCEEFDDAYPSNELAECKAFAGHRACLVVDRAATDRAEQTQGKRQKL